MRRPLRWIAWLGLVLGLAAGAGADPEVLVIGHGGDGPGLVTRLENGSGAVSNLPPFDAVTFLDGLQGTPSAATLADYDSVLVYTNDAPLFPDTLGDVLADFVDSGGRLVVATYGFSPGFGVEGTVMAGGYAPLLPDQSGSVAPPLVGETGQDGDTLFSNVSLGSVAFTHNANYAHPTLDSGATLLASDSSSPTPIPMVARSASGSTISINVYPADSTLSDDGLRLFANALNFERSQPAQITTVADGDWSSNATWDLNGTPDASLAAVVMHDVSLTTAGEASDSLDIDTSGGALTVSSGSLDPGAVRIGLSGTSEMTVEGGSVTPSGVTIGSGGSGTLRISGGTLDASGTLLVQDGTLEVAGDAGSLSAAALSFAAAGTFRVAPSAAGALSVLSAPSVTIDPSTALVLATDDYAPVADDVWTLVDYGAGGTRSGTFSDVSADPPLAAGLSLIVFHNVDDTIELRVVSGAVPALSPGAGAWLALALLAVGLAGRPRPEPTAPPRRGNG